MVLQKNLSIHIRLEYEDALNSKKNLLLIEKGFIDIENRIKSFSLLRKKDFSFKSEMKRNISQVKESIFRLESELPTEEMKFKTEEPEYEEFLNTGLKKVERLNESKIKNRERAVREDRKQDIELQLKEIQEKLNSLK